MEDWTVWEIVAYVDGRNEAYSSDAKQEAMSNDDFDEMLKRHNISTSVN